MEQKYDLVDASGFYNDFDKLFGITYYDNENKELILERKETPLYFFRKSIMHEYTHYIFQRMIDRSKGGTPSYPEWFQEGLLKGV